MILMNNDDTVHSIGHIEQTVSVMMQLLLMIEVMVTPLVTHLIRVKMVMMTGDMKVMTVATRRLVREKKLVSDVLSRMMVM